MASVIPLVADQGSTYSGDLESEAVSTPHSWEEELNHYALRSNALPEPDPELKPFSKGDVEQDLEADFPSGRCHLKKNSLFYKSTHNFLHEHYPSSLPVCFHVVTVDVLSSNS